MATELPPSSSEEGPAARSVAPEVRSRMIAGSAVLVAASCIVIWVIVMMALHRFPIYGWWPVGFGLLGTAVAVFWGCWYYSGRSYYAVHGLDAVARIVSVQSGTSRTSRKAVLVYEVEGRIFRSIHDDPLMIWHEGHQFAILVDPQFPDRWIRRDAVFSDSSDTP